MTAARSRRIPIFFWHSQPKSARYPPRHMMDAGNRTVAAVHQVPLPRHHSSPSPARQATEHGGQVAAVRLIVSTFRQRVATGLQTGRGFSIPEQQDQASGTTDFELVTWLVIKQP